ncbi:glycosyltransferase [Aeromicrobium fastidiosum]|nr:glycosyltransferase [Aeromicrobium fastidiosum]MBP2390060.1 glycosyltransferase involved in cell wall biosynthesis [Aeromicrobium fastidiosum]
MDTIVVPAAIRALDSPNRGTATGRATVLVPLTYAFDEPVEQILGAAEARPDLRWLLTGKAPEGLSAAAPDNVEFTGYLTDADYTTAQLSADVICALTTQEGTMQSAGFEALATGTPLLTSPTRVLKNYFGSAAAYSAPVPGEIVAQIDELIRNGDAWRRRMLDLRHHRIAEQQQQISSAVDSINKRSNGRASGRRILP